MKCTSIISVLALSLICTFYNLSVNAQCPLPQPGFGSGIAPTPGNSVVIGTCNFVGEYETVNDIVSGDSYTVNYSGGNGVYVVVYDNTPTPVAWGDTTVQFTAATSGTYYSAVFMDSSCNTTDPGASCNTSLWTNNGQTAHLQSLSALTFSAVPNPTKDLINISFEGSRATILISNIQGGIVHSCQLNSGANIDLSSFDTGIYFLNLQTDGRSGILRIVRE